MKNLFFHKNKRGPENVVCQRSKFDFQDNKNNKAQ